MGSYQLLLQFGLPVFMLLVVGIGIGGLRERRHLKSLALREAQNADVIVTNLKRIPEPEASLGASLVIGQVVIASDYFKTFATQLRNLVGGEMVAAENLLMRARREAVLRMIEEARRLGSTEVHNLRFVTCSIMAMSGNNKAIAVELCAYGTAILRSDGAAAHVQPQP